MPGHEIETKSSYDSLLNATAESRLFNHYQLKDGASLTLIQRVGYAVLGLVFFGAGLLFLTLEIGSIREYFLENGFEISVDLLGSTLFAIVAACVFMLGCLVLKNVLTFSKKS
jgi:hypothetical protein